MTSMQLFENFSGVDEALLVQAAKLQTCPVAVKKAMPKHRLLIALIAILALLLFYKLDREYDGIMKVLDERHKLAEQANA